MKVAGHGLLILALTILTQIGGLAWALALPFRNRLPIFLLAYAALTLAVHQLAPLISGRQAIPCFVNGPLQLQSPLYCLLNRNYAKPALIGVARDLAMHMNEAYPGTVTQVLDANFPFFDGFPLLPHLSHKDGAKLDLAFWYDNGTRYQPGLTRSPLGYFAFEPGPTACLHAFPTLRWDLDWLQPLFPKYPLDGPRMRSALSWLAQDRRVGRVFLEPHLRESLGAQGANFGFQGCRAARHDDHIHIQL